MLSVLLLGTPELRLEGETVRVTRRKSAALAYYAAAQRAPVTREHLADLLWPELDRQASQRALRTALHDLRRALGPALVAAEQSVSLAPGTGVDALRFEAELGGPAPAGQALPATLALYRGDFLHGFNLPDAPAFEQWQTAERERYRRLAVRGFTRLASWHEAQGAYADALAALDEALRLDALQEDLQRAAVRLHYLAGDRAGAIRRYDALRQLLDEEMGVPPMAETRRLYDLIITDKLPIPPQAQAPAPPAVGRAAQEVVRPAPDELPFAGRASELEALRTAVEAHHLALIEGEAGIGKTRLAEEFSRAFARASQGLVLTGQAYELEQNLPYQPVVEALRRLIGHADWPALRARLDLAPVWQAEVARLLPELAPPSGPGAPPPPAGADESRLWEGVYQLLTAAARQRRVMVFLDDLHWADASTLGLLGYLIRRGQAADVSVVFVAATRPVRPRTPLATLVQTLTRSGRLSRVGLRPLPPEAVQALAQQLGPTHVEPLAEWLRRNSEGNPYILAELVRHARARGELRPDGELDTAVLAGGPVVPPTIYGLIQGRLAGLSEAARRVIDAAVAAGREFDFEVVARAAALSEQAALDALDEVRAAGLVRASGPGRYSFDHSLTMEVAYREAGEPRHRRLHRRVAEALESLNRPQLDAVAGLLAFHFSEGDLPERAAPYAFRAGQQAARLAAWAEAIVFFEQSVAGTPGGAARRAALMALGEARLRAGQAVPAAEALREALDLARPDSAEASRARRALGRAYLLQGRYEAAIELARRAPRDEPPEVRMETEFLWATALSLEGADLAEAERHLEQAAALWAAGPQSNPVRLAEIQFEQGSLLAQQGDVKGAIALYEAALRTTELASGEPAGAAPHPASAAMERRILAHNNLAYHLHLMGDPRAKAHAHAGLSLAQAHGALGLMPWLLSTLGELALAEDNLPAAETHFSEGLALAERLALPERIAGLTANLGLVAARRGAAVAATHHLSIALAQADAIGARHLAAQIRVWLAPLLPPAEARARLDEARAIAESGNRRRLLDEIERLEAALQQ